MLPPFSRIKGVWTLMRLNIWQEIIYLYSVLVIERPIMPNAVETSRQVIDPPAVSCNIHINLIKGEFPFKQVSYLCRPAVTISSSVAFLICSTFYLRWLFFFFSFQLFSEVAGPVSLSVSSQLVSWRVMWPGGGTTTYLGNVQSLASAWQRDKHNTTNGEKPNKRKKQKERGGKKERKKERK